MAVAATSLNLLKHGFAWNERAANGRLKAGPKRAAPGHETSRAISGIASDANARLSEKYRRLKEAGKHTNAAKIAVVSELVRWMWVIGLEVERELKGA